MHLCFKYIKNCAINVFYFRNLRNVLQLEYQITFPKYFKNRVQQLVLLKPVECSTDYCIVLYLKIYIAPLSE